MMRCLSFMFSISSGGGGSASPDAAAGAGRPMNSRSIRPPRKLAVVVGSTGTGIAGAAGRGRRPSPSCGSGRVGALAVDLALRCEAFEARELRELATRA
eukprot:14963570-Heterocapsa_arctica.AAC.1